MVQHDSLYHQFVLCILHQIFHPYATKGEDVATFLLLEKPYWKPLYNFWKLFIVQVQEIPRHPLHATICLRKNCGQFYEPPMFELRDVCVRKETIQWQLRKYLWIPRCHKHTVCYRLFFSISPVKKMPVFHPLASHQHILLTITTLGIQIGTYYNENTCIYTWKSLNFRKNIYL